MRWNALVAAVAQLAVICVGCRSIPYFLRIGTVSQEQAAPPVGELAVDGSQMIYLQRGRQVYVTKCTKCHAAMPIRRFAADDWTDDILPKMSKKAKLSGDEMEALAQYVVAVVGSPMAHP